PGAGFRQTGRRRGPGRAGPSRAARVLMARRRPWPPDPEPIGAALVDNHTHLTHIAEMMDDGDPGVAQHLQRAAAAGVDRVVQVGPDLESAAASLVMAAEYPQVV